MHAVVFKHTQEFGKLEVKNRFDFEDTYLSTFVPACACQEYMDHHPSPRGVRVFLRPLSHDFEARPYLEFVKQVQDETYFHVMQEGQPTGFTVVLS